LTKKLLSAGKYILLLGIGVILLAFAFKGIDLDDFISKIKLAKPFWLILSVVASLIAFWSRAYRWNMLIEPLGKKPKLDNTCSALMLGYLANLAFPRLGEVTRCATLNRLEKIHLDSLIGTVIVERIVDVLSLLFCIILIGLLEFDQLITFYQSDPVQEKLSGIFVLAQSPFFIAGAAIVICTLIFFGIRQKRKNTASPENKFNKLIKGITNGLATIKSLKNPLAFIFHTVLIWIMYYYMSYLCFFSLGATANLSWDAGLLVLVAGGLGMSAPVPGGLGTYHFMVIAALSIFNILRDDSIVFATLMLGSQILVVILFGGIAFLYLFFRQRNAKTNNA
jgi:glycosyltransferase 2 family protein